MTLNELIDYLQAYLVAHRDQADLPIHLDDVRADFGRKGYEPTLDEFHSLELGQVTNTTISPITYYPCLRLRNRNRR